MIKRKLTQSAKYLFILLFILVFGSVDVGYYQNSNIPIYPDWSLKNVKYEQDHIYHE